MKLRQALLAFSLAAISGTTHAGNLGPGTVLLDHAPVTLRADRAYLLVRWIDGEKAIPSAGALLVRKPTTDELVEYEAARNIALRKFQEKEINRKFTSQSGPFKKFEFNYEKISNIIWVFEKNLFLNQKKEKISLIEIQPGNYFISGIGFGKALNTCFCRGTVKFEAQRGIITDMGSFLRSRKDITSGIKELDVEPKWGSFGSWVIPSLAVRPHDETASFPAELAALPHASAKYWAVTKSINYYQGIIDRLPPVPGVLTYDQNKAIDLQLSAR